MEVPGAFAHFAWRFPPQCRVYREEAGSARNGTVGRKRLEFLLEVIWEFSLQFAHLETSSFLMTQVKYVNEPLLAPLWSQGRSCGISSTSPLVARLRLVLLLGCAWVQFNLIVYLYSPSLLLKPV